MIRPALLILHLGLTMMCGTAAMASQPRTSTSAPSRVAYRVAPVTVGSELRALKVEIRFRADPSGHTRLLLPDHPRLHEPLQQHAKGV